MIYLPRAPENQFQLLAPEFGLGQTWSFLTYDS